ncbi:hypothetical protein HA402_002771 [Bradysia odoriphaga]|nr:hypothetical protein HA402_002771 [Bradysia odoriphaga]
MDLLWKKTSDIAGSSYVNLFENVKIGTSNLEASMAPALRGMFSYTHKGDKSSVDFRLQGNQKFLQKKWIEAMASYNRSLCFAEIGSENVSMAFANRSACFYHLKEYKKSLIDIELAVQANYPSHLMPKLIERRENCLKSIQAGEGTETFEPVLSYESSEVLPGCADVLKIQVNAQLGRFVTANCNIPAGKTVLVEEAFMGRPGETRYGRCAVCCKAAMNFIACSICTNAMFCDTNCVNAKNVHEMECNYNYDDTNKLELHLEFIAHSIFVAMSIFSDIDSLMDFVQDVVKEKSKPVPQTLNDEKSKYRAFLQLSFFFTPSTWEDYLGLAHDWYNNLMLRDFITERFDTEEKKTFFMHLTLHHIMIASTNAYVPAPGDARLLCIASSYFNHSCEPNVFRVNYQNSLVFITTRPIRAGEQLYVRYNESIDGESVARRQNHFMEKYGFRCKCERCEPAVPGPLVDMYTKGLAAHPDYQYVLTEIQQEPGLNFEDNAKLMLLQSKCLDLLNQFGDDHWFPALGSLTSIFSQIYKKMLHPHDDNVGFNFIRK